MEVPDTELVLRSRAAPAAASAAEHTAKVKMAQGISRLANASFLSGGYEQALQAYGEALALTPEDGALMLARAHCYIKVGEGASEATAETMFVLATADAELAAQLLLSDVTAAARAQAARAEALFLLERGEDAGQALGLALAAAPSDAAVLQAQMRLTPKAAAPAPAAKAGRFAKIGFGKKAAAAGPAPEAEIQQLSAAPSLSLHVVAPAQRPSDAVVELQLGQVLDEMGLGVGSAERGAVESLGMDQKWSMVEAAQQKRVIDQNQKAQEYAAAQAALAKRGTGPGGAAGWIAGKVAALPGGGGGGGGGGGRGSEGVGLITHWDGSSSVAPPQPAVAAAASSAAVSATAAAPADTRWMCVEPDIAWQKVEFLATATVSDATSGDTDGRGGGGQMPPAEAEAVAEAEVDTPQYIIYRLRCCTVDGRSWKVAKRYSEFVGFREELLLAGLAIKHLSFPPKTTWGTLAGRSSERLVETRKTQLQAWFTALIGMYPDQVLIGVFLHADSDLAQLQTLRLKWSKPDRALSYAPKGWTMMHTAAQRGDLVTIQDAVDEGFLATSKSRTINGTSSSDDEGEGGAAEASSASGDEVGGREAVRPDAVDFNGQTPLHIAAREGHADIVFSLLGGGASGSVVSCGGHTPLHIAAREGNASSVNQLCWAIKRRLVSDLDLASQTGDTALHYAAVALHKNAVQVLLEHNASPHATNMLADTPLNAVLRAHGGLPGGGQPGQQQQVDLQAAFDLQSPRSPSMEDASSLVAPIELPEDEGAVARREMVALLQAAMSATPAPAPRPPPRPPTPQQQAQQQAEHQHAQQPLSLSLSPVGFNSSSVDVEGRSSHALVIAAVESGAANGLRCVGRTTVRVAPELSSKKVGALTIGTEVTAHEVMQMTGTEGGQIRRLRIGRLGQLNGWVSLHSTKSGGLLFEAVPAAAAAATATTATPSPFRPTWQYSRDLSLAYAKEARWCSAADTARMRSFAANLHSFYQGNCLGGAGAIQLLASPRSAQGGLGVAGDVSELGLYDDDSWLLEDDLDSPVSASSASPRAVGDAGEEDGEGSPLSLQPAASGGGGTAPMAAGRVMSPLSPEASPVSHDFLANAAEAVGTFAPAASDLFLQAVAVDRAAGPDAPTAALDLYTQGLQSAMGVVRTAADKEPMKKALEAFFSRAFVLRGEVAAAKTARAAAAAAFTEQQKQTAKAKARAKAKTAAASGPSEGVPPLRVKARVKAKARQPTAAGGTDVQDFLAARKQLQQTLEAPSPTARRK